MLNRILSNIIIKQSTELWKGATASARFPFLHKMSTDASISPAEKILIDKLTEKLNVTAISVCDISGGCGAMYEVDVSSIDFKGKNTLQQHRLVTQILKEDVKTMHGLRIQTSVPEEAT